jgi:hypothetical protein
MRPQWMIAKFSAVDASLRSSLGCAVRHAAAEPPVD